MAMASVGVKAEFTGRNDITVDGRKFSGNAFKHTQTCSMQHGTLLVSVDMELLSRYLRPPESKLKAKGIDEIVCTAVNDAFVMGAWAKNAGATDSVTMLADGNGDFAEAVGLTMDGKAFGMGKRGQRFSMVVNDGVVEQLNVEAPGEFKVSSADHMLEQL